MFLFIYDLHHLLYVSSANYNSINNRRCRLTNVTRDKEPKDLIENMLSQSQEKLTLTYVII